MSPRLACLVVVVALASGYGSASAQVPDHLKCYRIRDSAPRATYVADLDGIAPEPGCRVRVPAKMICIETRKQNVQPPPPGGGPSGIPAGQFACYKVRCPKTARTPFEMTDQFGTRAVRPMSAKLLCAPVSTTLTPSTTTPPTTCGQIRPCCWFGMCQLGCSLLCPSVDGCTYSNLGSACGSFTP